MAERRRTLPELFAELKRRRVIRVLIAYVIAAVAVLQTASVLVPALLLPSRLMTVLAVLALVGLPVALVLAWMFDVTPGGVTRTDGVHEEVDSGALEPRRSLLPFAVVGLVALAVFITGWFAFRRGDAVAAEVDAGLFAVLPFRVSGADPSLAYLQEGMVDLLSVKLAEIPPNR